MHWTSKITNNMRKKLLTKMTNIKRNEESDL